MTKKSILPVLSVAFLMLAGCSSDDAPDRLSETGGTPGTGGKGTTGGSVGAGGSEASGGEAGNGDSTGGVDGTGATPGSGGDAVGGAPTGGTESTSGGSEPTTGGASSGGSEAGGTEAGGSSSGGSEEGGTTTGGATTGGENPGGASTGGEGTGGDGTGGADTTGCRVWLSPSGNDDSDGTQGSPVATLLAAYNLVCEPPPSGTDNGTECIGDAPRTICAESGTYDMDTRFEFKKTRMGTASNRITLMAAPDASSRPVFDFSSQPRVDCGANPSDGNLGGFTVNADYVTVKDVVVSHANDNCIKVQGSEGIVEHVAVHHCADAGLQISDGSGYDNSGDNNLILNCDSYQNNDTQCDGENADGFAVKEGEGQGTGNVFRGCRAWDNADDGWDLYAWPNPVTIEDSWAVNQAATTEGSESDGNGFKLGGDDVSAQHVLIDLVAVSNRGGSSSDGFTNNSNPADLSCSGTCASWDNGGQDVVGVRGVSTSAIGGANVTNMTADTARNADGSLRDISSL